MKIKVIDLLIKIANGEQVPEKIKYENKIWEYDAYSNDYKGEDIWLFEELFEYKRTIEFINDDVEIIEEPKKIKKIEIYEDSNGHYFYDKHCKKIYITCDEIDFMVDKFNELIDEIQDLLQNAYIENANRIVYKMPED